MNAEVLTGGKSSSLCLGASVVKDQPSLNEVTGLVWTAHPLLGLPEVSKVAGLLGIGEEGRRVVYELWKRREERLGQAEEDPYRFGFELEHWKDADELLWEVLTWLFVLGGIRSGKSWYCRKRVMDACVAYGDGTVLVMDESHQASIMKVQRNIWEVLPPELKALNGRRDPVFKVSYTQANGFADGKLVLPNRTELVFLNYSQDPKDYQGLALGFPAKSVERWKRENPGKRPPANIGGWADESLTPNWATLLEERCSTYGAKLLWSFAAVYGLTATMKEKIGTTARTLRARRAKLLDQERVHVEGCGPGEVPYIQEPGADGVKGSRVIYFHSDLNLCGGYERVELLCGNKTSEEVQRLAYGYARDTAGRGFPKFGAVHIVRRGEVPAAGTNFMLTDPAGSRNFATIWARVAPGHPSKVYIYRDWPDKKTYGEWAVPSDNPLRFDGDAGPAQRSLGLGDLGYKQVWRGLERESLAGQASCADGGNGSLHPKGEKIFMRLIDSRAGQSAHAAAVGGTCLVDRFGEVNRDGKTGEVLKDGEGMFFELASGERVELGMTAVNGLLEWDPRQKFDSVTNSPRLFVSEDCEQVIWALSNYTGRDGEKGACKDFVDLVRYLAEDVDKRVIYVGKGMLEARGGGSY